MYLEACKAGNTRDCTFLTRNLNRTMQVQAASGVPADDVIAWNFS